MRIVEKIKFVKMDGPILKFTSNSHGINSEIFIMPEDNTDIPYFEAGKEYDVAMIRQYTIQNQEHQSDKNGTIHYFSMYLTNVLFSQSCDPENPLLNLTITTKEEAVVKAIDVMDKLSDEDRVSVMRKYCRYCGSKKLQCFCERDD